MPWFSVRSSINSVVIENGVTSIGGNAFYNCYQLTSVTIPESVTSIEYRAFSDCYRLTSVTIPESMMSIGERAFYLCSGLTSVTIPSSVMNIGNSAFSGCSGLTSVTIPDSVMNIGSYAFWGCSGLPSVTIPSSVTNIGNSAFSKCSGLLSATIPEGVTSIGSSAFSGCSGMKELWLPVSLRTIETNVFSGCSYLFDVYYASDNLQWAKITGTDQLSKADIHFATEPLTITFRAGGQSEAFDTQTASVGVPFSLPENPFEVSALQRFKAWRIGETEYASGDSFTPTADTTATAVWENAPIVEAERSGTTLTYTVSAPAGATLIATSYEANGRMVDVKTISVTVDWADHTGSVKLTAGATCKLMLVDGNSVPLCPAWEG